MLAVSTLLIPFSLISKISRVRGSAGVYGCEIFRILHYLHNRLTDDDDVSLAHMPRLTYQKQIFISPLAHISVRG
jgi:hypothetical protein